jgi:hypothetical protein
MTPRFTPTFENYTTILPKLDRDGILNAIPLVPHAAVDYAPEDFFRMYTNMLRTTSRIDLQFTKKQVQAMHIVAQTTAEAKIGIKDALAAYLIGVLNRVEDVPATIISNVISVRDPHGTRGSSELDVVFQYRGVPPAPGSEFIPPPSTSLGNVCVVRYSDKIPAGCECDIGQVLNC